MGGGEELCSRDMTTSFVGYGHGHPRESGKTFAVCLCQFSGRVKVSLLSSLDVHLPFALILLSISAAQVCLIRVATNQNLATQKLAHFSH